MAELPYGLGAFSARLNVYEIQNLATAIPDRFAQAFAQAACVGDIQLLAHVLRERNEWCRVCLPDIERCCREFVESAGWGYEWACLVLGARCAAHTPEYLANLCRVHSYGAALRVAVAAPEIVADALEILAGRDAADGAVGEPRMSNERLWLTKLQSGMALRRRAHTKPARYPEAPAEAPAEP